MMKTGVPIRTRLNSHSADGICIRMQPCDSEWPIDQGSEVPWIPTPGALSPIQRVPSGFPGPGGTGWIPCAHEALAVEQDEAVHAPVDDDDRPGLDVGRLEFLERRDDRRPRPRVDRVA